MKLEGTARQKYARAVRLMESMHRLRHAWAGVHPPAPLKRSDVMLMGAIRDIAGTGGMVTVGSLAHAMHQSPPGITQKINGMEREGLVRRVPSEKDKRVICIEMTAQGKTIADEAFHQFLEQIDAATEKMGDEKTATLVELMDELSQVMCQQKQGQEPQAPAKPLW